MRRLLWLGLSGLIGLALFRAFEFAALCWYDFHYPLEVQFLEAKFTHLCWRFQQGLPLYRNWREYPHVPNFFGPVYPIAVGGLGRLLGLNLEGLTRLARGFSILSILVGAMIAAGWSARRYGWASGLLAGLVSVGSLPTLRFSAMARPDVMSDGLGLAGLVLAASPGQRPARRAAGIALLAAASLTKQTAAVYTLSAVLALALQSRWKLSAAVGLGVATLVAALVLGSTLAFSPYLASSLLAERHMPYDPLSAWFLFRRLHGSSPEIATFLLLGLFAWTRPAYREPVGLSLALVATPLMALASLKVGSDYNYYLPIRMASALGAGAWMGWAWDAASRPGRVRWLAALLTTLAAWQIIPGLLNLHASLMASRQRDLALHSPEGQRYLESWRKLQASASDSRYRVLTDLGLVALHQGDRAAFVDPWLFRMLVNEGQIRPMSLLGQIRRGDYDLVITHKPVESDDYLEDQFSLPQALALAVRARYLPLPGQEGPLRIYVPAPVPGAGGN